MRENINDEISKKIDSIAARNNIYHSGEVVRINKFIVEAIGLDDVFYFEKVYVGGDSNIGYVDRIEENKVIISMVKITDNIFIGDKVMSTHEPLMTSFSEDSMGMIIDPFGYDKMTGKKINNSKDILIETPKIPLMKRKEVVRPLKTGIAAIDLLYPIGKGQRQLIIGDKKTGKTEILLDTIVNQKNDGVICIYVSIGKTKKELKRFYSKLVEKGAHAYTLCVATFNDDPSPLIKLTPYVAMSIAEEYMNLGLDVLVCIDDLKKHADACREIALLSEKNTGREAYPSDIFYTHSRLLEKGCEFVNGGSITILPVVETRGSDITDYISTNVISITDGQIVLSENMFKKGQKPALDFGLSVSRLGSKVQSGIVKKIGAEVRRELLSYLETKDIYELVNEENMSEELASKMKQGQKILNLLKQPKLTSINDRDLIKNFGFILGDENIDGVLSNFDDDVQAKEKREQPIEPVEPGIIEPKEVIKENNEPVNQEIIDEVVLPKAKEENTLEETVPLPKMVDLNSAIELPEVNENMVESTEIERTELPKRKEVIEEVKPIIKRTRSRL